MGLAMLLGAIVVGLSVGLWLEKRQERSRREREEQVHLVARRMEPLRLPVRPRPMSRTNMPWWNQGKGWIESGSPSATEVHSDPTRRTS